MSACPIPLPPIRKFYEFDLQNRVFFGRRGFVFLSTRIKQRPFVETAACRVSKVDERHDFEEIRYVLDAASRCLYKRALFKVERGVEPYNSRGTSLPLTRLVECIKLNDSRYQQRVVQSAPGLRLSRAGR